MGNKINQSFSWEKIEKFYSYNEYVRFYNWLKMQVLNGQVEELPVTEYYAGPNLDEYWFKNKTGEIWRLVAPDFPFEGYWGPINQS